MTTDQFKATITGFKADAVFTTFEMQRLVDNKTIGHKVIVNTQLADQKWSILLRFIGNPDENCEAIVKFLSPDAPFKIGEAMQLMLGPTNIGCCTIIEAHHPSTNTPATPATPATFVINDLNNARAVAEDLFTFLSSMADDNRIPEWVRKMCCRKLDRHSDTVDSWEEQFNFVKNLTKSAGPPAVMDATEGPVCSCGAPSTYECGWCGGCDRGTYQITESA